MTDALNAATDLLQEAREKLSHAEASRVTNAIRHAQIRLDLLTLGSEAVLRKIYDGHEYGKIGTKLGSE